MYVQQRKTYVLRLVMISVINNCYHAIMMDWVLHF